MKTKLVDMVDVLVGKFTYKMKFRMFLISLFL